MFFRKRNDTRQAEPPAAPELPAQPREAAPATPPLAFHTMKRQLSSTDARTDRLVRQLRDEIEGVRAILDEFSEEQEELLTADPAAIAADPRAAASLPPGLLVRTIIALEQERADVVAHAEALDEELDSVREELQQLRLSEAALRGRLETFEDVIAALHNNLEDLRFARDQARLSAEPAPLRLKALHESDDERDGRAGATSAGGG